jgi:hypothetical protein
MRIRMQCGLEHPPLANRFDLSRDCYLVVAMEPADGGMTISEHSEYERAPISLEVLSYLERMGAGF